MITPFGLRHIWLLRELQSACTELDLRSALEEPSAPLQAALRGYFLRDGAGVHTYVLRAADPDKTLGGFVQARVHRNSISCLGQGAGSAWRVIRIAPILDHSEDAATIWYRLLLHLCIVAGERQVQRLFACLPEAGAVEDVFRQASFVTYCHEQVYAKAPGSKTGRESPAMQLAGSEDLVAVRRLWQRAVPRTVLQAEDPDSLRGSSPLFESPFSDAERSYVLRAPAGEISGYLYMLVRPRGAWLRLMSQPEKPECIPEMLDHALAMLEDRPRPVYCAVREYEGGMRGSLEERGFTPLDNYSLLVKHTTVRVREPARRIVPALEKRVEVTPTVSRSEAGER